jgi:hypothetical protein
MPFRIKLGNQSAHELTGLHAHIPQVPACGDRLLPKLALHSQSFDEPHAMQPAGLNRGRHS